MTTPKVSVCMPVYNGAAYIAESIESVLAQTYKDFRLIVCDNCSADNTGDIVRSFDDDRITYVRNERNLGLVGNANRCLDLADGEYIHILHHDDLMLPENLERKVCLLDENREVGFVHSNISIIDAEGQLVVHDWFEGARRDYIEDGRTVFREYLDYLPLGASMFIGAVLARKECYDRLGNFRHELPHCNDSEMLMRMLLFYDVACIGSSLVKYRVHPTSTSGVWVGYNSFSYIKEHYLAATMIFDRYKDHIPQADALLRQTSHSFGERVLNLAWGSVSGGNFDSGKTLLKEAVNIYPGVLKKSTYWKTAARLLAGSKGLQFYQTARKHLGGNYV